MQKDSFNLVQAFTVWQQRWKTILAFVLIAGAAATITVFVVPPYFRSSALLVSANTALADKGRFFNKQVQSLYSYFGSGDDLDRIYGIADMDTSYLQLVDEFSLINYYQISADSLPIQRKKAVKQLRKNLSLQKTELAQIRISCWTKNKALSAALVNRMVAILQESASAIWQKNYHTAYNQFAKALNELENEYQLLTDSLPKTNGAKRELVNAKLQSLLVQIKDYHTTADEFKLAASAPPAALYVLEPAVAAPEAERPDKPGIILAALLAGFVFSSLLVLVTERNPQA